jgi:hypothetical protein
MNAAAGAGGTPTNQQLPTISGTTQPGQTLTATAGSWSGPRATYDFLWQRCSASGASCAPIDGATATTYSLSSNDVGSTVAVAVTASNKNGSAVATSSPTSVVAPPPSGSGGSGSGSTAPTVVTLGTISGTAVAGSTLTTTNGTWTGSPTSYAYSWYRCDSAGANCAGIANAAGQSYALQSTDAGSTLRVHIAAFNASGATVATTAQSAVVQASASSSTSAPTNTSAPTISGAAVVGSTLSAATGSWTGSPSYAYGWNRCSSTGTNCATISAPAGPTYVVATADQGFTIQVRVTATNTAGSASATSNVTSPVTASGGGTPSGSGSGLFTGDFETGDLSQWNWGSQCSNTGTSSDGSIVRGPVSVESSLVGEGGFAARFDLPANGLRQACEVLDHRPLVTDTYYSLMFYLPASGQTTNSWGTTLAQLNYQGIWGPPEGLFAVNSTTLGEAVPNAVIMVLQSGFCYSVYSSSPGCTNVASVYQSTLSMPAQYAVPPGQLTLGVWHELVCHIHFAVDSSGVFECWHKLKGQTAWTKTGSYTGYPTVQWTATPKLPSEDVDKIGAYRPGDSTAWTQYMDGFRAGTSFNAVAATLP